MCVCFCVCVLCVFLCVCVCVVVLLSSQTSISFVPPAHHNTYTPTCAHHIPHHVSTHVHLYSPTHRTHHTIYTTVLYTNVEYLYQYPPSPLPHPGLCPIAPFDVLVTCYTLFERDTVDQRLDRKCLTKFAWSHVVLDEAHALKNSASARTKHLRKYGGVDGCVWWMCVCCRLCCMCLYKALRALTLSHHQHIQYSSACELAHTTPHTTIYTNTHRICNNARHRIMLTGTPLNNDLKELVNLLAFLLPTVFGGEEQQELVNTKVRWRVLMSI